MLIVKLPSCSMLSMRVGIFVRIEKGMLFWFVHLVLEYFFCHGILFFDFFSRLFLLFSRLPPLAYLPRRGRRGVPEICVFRPAAPPQIFAFPTGRAVDRPSYFLRFPFERLGCAVFFAFPRPSFFFGVIHTTIRRPPASLVA